MVTDAVSSPHGVAWVLAGQWQLADGERLEVQHGIGWADQLTVLRPIGADARLLLTRLSRVP